MRLFEHLKTSLGECYCYYMDKAYDLHFAYGCATSSFEINVAEYVVLRDKDALLLTLVKKRLLDVYGFFFSLGLKAMQNMHHVPT